MTEETATIVFEVRIPLAVQTEDGDACAVLDNHDTDIHDILTRAIKSAIAELEEKVGRLAGEWSGVDLDFWSV